MIIVAETHALLLKMLFLIDFKKGNLKKGKKKKKRNPHFVCEFLGAQLCNTTHNDTNNLGKGGRLHAEVD